MLSICHDCAQVSVMEGLSCGIVGIVAVFRCLRLFYRCIKSLSPSWLASAFMDSLLIQGGMPPPWLRHMLATDRSCGCPNNRRCLYHYAEDDPPGPRLLSKHNTPSSCQSIPEPVRQSIRRRNQTVMNHQVVFVCGALIALNHLCGLRAAYLVANLITVRMNEA